jgi:hypothetical protein
VRIAPLLALLLAAPWPVACGAEADVRPVDPAAIKLSDFANNELDLPYYLVNFHRVANAIPLEGDLRGWITLSVWRGDANQRTYNARVLESNLSLAYFYCTKRPWNPYYGDPAVRARLDAMLERWCAMQSPDGKFSEYAEGRWGLAPTAFATKFMGETLRLLKDGPPIDSKLHERVKAAQRKAILVTLADSGFWEQGRKFSNQFSNVFAGGLAWLALFPDDSEVRTALMKRMREAATEFQSPAGYFYEREGADWGYNLSTHHSNLHVAWHYARGTEFEPLVLDEVRRFYDWIAWNAVIEPDGSGFVLNRAIETRQRRPWIAISGNPQSRNFSGIPQAEVVESARAFLPSREQESDALRELRAELEAQWPNVPSLQEGNFRAFTPYAFLHRDMVQWLPTEAQQTQARAALPYLRDGRFAHLRADSRRDVSFLYVRRPNYYVVFNAGEQLDAGQRYGLGLLWAPGVGTLAQSQTASNEQAWATVAQGADAPYEAADLDATIENDGRTIEPEPGAHDLGQGSLTVNYPLGGKGRKTIRFDDDRIRVEVGHPGAFSETVPLLKREGDSLRIENNRVILERAGTTALVLEIDAPAKVELSDEKSAVGPYQVVTARIQSADALSYTVVIPPPRN